MDVRQEVKSLKKALRVLTYMNQCGDSTVAEVASAIGVPRPTSYRILETLASEGYIEKQPHCGLYRITSLVQRLAAGFQNEELLLEVAKPMIQQLSKELGWPIAIYTPRDTRMVARIITDHDCVMALERFHIGFAAPMLESATGYCYLARCSDAERERLLAFSLSEEGCAKEASDPEEIRYLIVDKHFGHLERFNNRQFDEISYLINAVRNQGFCNLEFQKYREGNLGVPLVLDDKPVGGIVMRYIRSTMKNTGRIQNFYAPKLQKLSQDVTDEYFARMGSNPAVAAPKASASPQYKRAPAKDYSIQATA